MRIPVTRYGLPQVVAFPAAVLVLLGVVFATGPYLLPWGAIYVLEAVLGGILVWILMFFRDPRRVSPADSNILLSPADGRITDIEVVDEEEFIGAKAFRIGIFLSVFNVHINRAPCRVRVKKITYKQGRYKNALSSESARVNESNALGLIRMESPEDRLVVRQISGAIARRIVCATAEGQELVGGEKFGMIKFGSRTELYLPMSDKARCLVQTGDRVKAGLTSLVRYET
jgi:phosphatidylserine decarboxylase